MRRVLPHLRSGDHDPPIRPQRRLIRTASGEHPLASSELKAITEFVDAHIAEDIAVDRLARLVGLSPNHFSRRFRASTGLAPHQFLTRRRLDRAVKRLATTRHPVTQIGLMIGYANPSHFAMALRGGEGVTPLAWRRTR